MAFIKGIPYIYNLTFSIIIGFMPGCAPFQGGGRWAETGQARRKLEFGEKGANDNREDEDPISLGSIATEADSKSIL